MTIGWPRVFQLQQAPRGLRQPTIGPEISRGVRAALYLDRDERAVKFLIEWETIGQPVEGGSPGCFSARPVPQDWFIQVGTPNFGSTHFMSTM